MTEEIKKDVDETTIPPAQEEETNEADSKLGEDESKQTESTDGAVDYKALLEAEKLKRENAETALQKAEKAIVANKRKAKVEEEEEEEEETTGDPDLEDRIVSRLAEKMESEENKRYNALIEDKITDAIGSVSTDADEKKAIEFFYQNKIQKGGYDSQSIKEDVEYAKIMVNKSKLILENKELKESLRSSATASQAASFSTQGTDSTKEITEDDRKIIDRYFGGDTERYLKIKKEK